jgi:hypothetical protein
MRTLFAFFSLSCCFYQTAFSQYNNNQQQNIQNNAFFEYIENGGSPERWTTVQGEYTKQYTNNNYQLNNSGSYEIKKTYKSGTISSSNGSIIGRYENSQILNNFNQPLGYYSNGWFYNYSNQCIGGVSGTSIVNCQGSSIAKFSNNTLYDNSGYVLGYLQGDNFYSSEGSLVAIISGISMQNLTAFLLFLN